MLCPRCFPKHILILKFCVNIQLSWTTQSLQNENLHVACTVNFALALLRLPGPLLQCVYREGRLSVVWLILNLCPGYSLDRVCPVFKDWALVIFIYTSSTANAYWRFLLVCLGSTPKVIIGYLPSVKAQMLVTGVTHI